MLCRKIAQKSTCVYQLGAVLFKGGNVINVGFNKTGTNILQYRKRHLHYVGNVHAEIDAILGVSKEEAKKCDLWVVRIISNGNFALAKPCIMCREILSEMGIKRIFYSVESNPFYDIIYCE